MRPTPTERELVAAAGNISTPPVALERLATDRREAVRVAAIGNPKTPRAAILHAIGFDDLAIGKHKAPLPIPIPRCERTR